MNKTIAKSALNLLLQQNRSLSDGVLIGDTNRYLLTNILLEIDEITIVHPQEALSELRSLENITDPQSKGLVLAAAGRAHSYYGDYTKAYAAFRRALEVVKSEDGLAYVHSAMSNLLRKLGHHEEVIDSLNRAVETTKNEGLRNLLKFQTALCYKYSEPEKAILIMEESVKFYQNQDNKVRTARVKRHMAHSYHTLGVYDKADRLYNEALETAVVEDLPQFQYELLSDRGWMWHSQGKQVEARSLFRELITKVESPYQLALCLQNLGVVEYKMGNHRQAIKNHSQSLQLTKRYEMKDMMFEDYYRLGLCHERTGDLGLAAHFYSTGYYEVLEEMKMRLPILDYRQKLLEKYPAFLEAHQQIPAVNAKENIFSFAVGKTLKDIRSIFHAHFFNILLSRTKNAPELCRLLQIDNKTFFNYQKRLGIKRGLKPKTKLSRNWQFMNYVESLSRLTWREANSTFESDLLSFLLEEYQYNKMDLAEVLGISYPHLVNMTSGRD